MQKGRPFWDMSMHDGSSRRFSIAEIRPHVEEAEDSMQQEIWSMKQMSRIWTCYL